MANLSTFQDNFNDNSIDTAKWNESEGNTTVDEVNKQLEFTLAVDPNTGYASLESDNSYNLTGNQGYIEVIQLPASGGNSESYFTLFVDSNNNIEWFSAWGWLYANYKVSGSTTWLGEIEYSAGTTDWLRIRESGGTTYWDYSGDGISWTNLTSVSNPITVTALYTAITAGNWEVEAVPGYFKVDNFNVRGPMGVKTVNDVTLSSNIKTINGVALVSVNTLMDAS